MSQAQALPDGWIKASRSAPNNGGCVELAPRSGGIAIRDGKAPGMPHLLFTPHELRTFFDAVKAGEFDHLT